MDSPLLGPGRLAQKTLENLGPETREGALMVKRTALSSLSGLSVCLTVLTLLPEPAAAQASFLRGDANGDAPSASPTLTSFSITSFAAIQARLARRLPTPTTTGRYRSRTRFESS